jgi:thiol-disulfide isomerase/thioredoxin
MARTIVIMISSALGVVSQLTPILAQETLKNDPSKREKPAAALHIGDPAPALKVTRRLQGDAVTTFEPGKVYVVEFWATWCGAPIRYMPYLAELQARFKDQGVTIISFTLRPPESQPRSSRKSKKKHGSTGRRDEALESRSLVCPPLDELRI